MKERFKGFFSGPNKSTPEAPQMQQGGEALPCNPQSQINAPIAPTIHSEESYQYHHAKEIIEKEITRLKIESGNQNLPAITFERKKDENKIEFKIDKNADLYRIISNLSETLGKMEINSLMSGNVYLSKNDLTIYLFNSAFGDSISFQNKKDLSDQEIESIIKTYKLANVGTERPQKDPRQRLTEMGATVYDPTKAPDWDYLAGYSAQKQQVRETIINSFLHPETYEQIARGTRKNYESNRPRAVLFEGPPGTGKTTMARMIAGQVTAPLIYVPIESIMTKWYGESEKNLAEVFNAAEKWGSSIIFLDEIDSLATTRDNNIHEATRRVMSVLLRKIDGFTPTENIILIGATNRKKDLDSALLDRFDTSINFPLPNGEERQAIFKGYAQHLREEDLAIIAKGSENLSGREIKNACERVERSWASKLIKGETELKLPTCQHYLALLRS